MPVNVSVVFCRYDDVDALSDVMLLVFKSTLVLVALLADVKEPDILAAVKLFTRLKEVTSESINAPSAVTCAEDDTILLGILSSSV